MSRPKPLLAKILSVVWIIAATSFLIWIGDLNERDAACDDGSQSGYCAEVLGQP